MSLFSTSPRILLALFRRTVTGAPVLRFWRVERIGVLTVVDETCINVVERKILVNDSKSDFVFVTCNHSADTRPPVPTNCTLAPPPRRCMMIDTVVAFDSPCRDRRQVRETGHISTSPLHSQHNIENAIQQCRNRMSNKTNTLPDASSTPATGMVPMTWTIHETSA